jgi:hypothetical protein
MNEELGQGCLGAYRFRADWFAYIERCWDTTIDLCVARIANGLCGHLHGVLGCGFLHYLDGVKEEVLKLRFAEGGAL